MTFRNNNLRNFRLPTSIFSAFLTIMVPQIAQASEEAVHDLSSHDERLKLNIYNKDWHSDQNMQRAKDVVDGVIERTSLQGSGANPYRSMDSDDITIPDNYSPWWASETTSQLNPSSQAFRETPESVAMRALANSAQIKVFADIPVIRETAELEILGRYDTRLYAEGRWTDIDDPVGSELTTGGPDRFKEDEWLAKIGLRKKFITGTEIDVSQRWGVTDNNSEFFVPADQANTRMSLTLTQPLLNGRGIRYHRNSIDITRIDASVAMDEFKRQVESHLLEVIRAYWGVWLERSSLIQQRKLLAMTSDLVGRLNKRSDHDAGSAQINRARSEVIRRKSHVVRAESAVRNAEARLLGLVNDPNLRMDPTLEIIPEQAPLSARDGVSLDTALSMALENRPEIQQSFKQLRAASIRAQMTRHELQPVLNLVLQYYRDGIAGESDTGEAYDRQWDDGDGSFVVGLVMEWPLRNRAAKARDTRRKVEIRQLSEQLRTTLETVSLEIQVSKREVETSWREMHAKYAAMDAVQQEITMLLDREGVEVSNGTRGADYIERVIDAQDRLSQAEFEFLRSQISYSVSLSNMDRATGTFLSSRDIVAERTEDDIDGLQRLQMRHLKTN